MVDGGSAGGGAPGAGASRTGADATCITTRPLAAGAAMAAYAKEIRVRRSGREGDIASALVAGRGATQT